MIKYLWIFAFSLMIQNASAVTEDDMRFYQGKILNNATKYCDQGVSRACEMKEGLTNPKAIKLPQRQEEDQDTKKIMACGDNQECVDKIFASRRNEVEKKCKNGDKESCFLKDHSDIASEIIK